MEALDARGKRIDWGTGFVAGDGVVLTAYHVTARRKTAPFEPKGARLQLVLTRFGAEAPVVDLDPTPLAADPALDYALHRVQEGLPHGLRPIVCGAGIERGAPFTGFGYSHVNPVDGLEVFGLVSDPDGRLTLPSAAPAPVLQLFVEQAAGTHAKLAGLSGGPILHGGRAIGLVRTYPERDGAAVAATLYATRMQDVLRSPEARAALRVDPCADLPPLPEAIPWPSGGPYRDLHPYGPDDARVFYGRCLDLDRLGAALEASAPRLVLLVGRTGVGKSSLLHAGLVPRWQGRFDVGYARRDYEVGLAAQLHALRDSTSSPRLLVLDQLEEALTRPREGENELAALALALRGLLAEHPEARVLLGLRKEWYQEVTAALGQADLRYETRPLVALGPEAIEEVVLGPTRDPEAKRRFGLTIPPEVAARIRGALMRDGGAAIAPQLQALLTRLWTDAGGMAAPDKAFTVEAVETLEREGLGLDRVLERRLAELDAPRGLVLDLLEAHTTPAGTAAVLDAPARADRYGHVAGIDRLVAALKDRHLLTSPSQEEGATLGADAGRATRLSHDALAPHVTASFRDSVEPAQRARRILETRDATAPLDAHDLGVVEAGEGQMRAWSEAERDLVRRSRAAREAAEAGRAAAEAATRRGQRIRRALVTVLVLASLGAAVAGLIARSALQNLEYEVEQRKVVDAARLFATSHDLAAEDGDVIDALRYAALAASLLPEGYPQISRYTSRAMQLALAGPAHITLVPHEEGQIEVRGRHVFALQRDTLSVRDVTLSPAGGLTLGPRRELARIRPPPWLQSVEIVGGRFRIGDYNGRQFWAGDLETADAPPPVRQSRTATGGRVLRELLVREEARERRRFYTVGPMLGLGPRDVDSAGGLVDGARLDLDHSRGLWGWTQPRHIAWKQGARCPPPPETSRPNDAPQATRQLTEDLSWRARESPGAWVIVPWLSPERFTGDPRQATRGYRLRLDDGSELRVMSARGALTAFAGPYRFTGPDAPPWLSTPDGPRPRGAAIGDQGRLGAIWSRDTIAAWQNARPDPQAELPDTPNWILDGFRMPAPIAQACFRTEAGAHALLVDLEDGRSIALYIDETFTRMPAWLPDLPKLTGQVRTVNGAMHVAPGYLGGGPAVDQLMQAIRQDPSVGARLLCRHYQLEGCAALPAGL